MLTTTATLLFLLITSAIAALVVHETLGSGRKQPAGASVQALSRVRSEVEALDAAVLGVEALQEDFAASVEQRFLAATKDGSQHESAIAAVFQEARNGNAELRTELEQLRMVVAGLSAQIDSAKPSEKRFAEIERSLQSQDMRLCTLEESVSEVALSLQPDNSDLKRIKGIGATLEKTLKGLGIETVEQVANLSVDEIEVLSIELGAFAKRIERDKWIDQAKALVG